MTWAERFPSIQQPEMEDIAEWIGQPLFLELRDWMADTYGQKLIRKSFHFQVRFVIQPCIVMVLVQLVY